MDKKEFLEEMTKAVNNPRLTALFVSLQTSAETTPAHYYEVFCGFQYLREYIKTNKEALLQEAIRQFDYVIEIQDKKFVQAISFYGRAIAYAYYQDGSNISEAYKWIEKLLGIGVYPGWGTEKPEFIQDLQTEAEHLRKDIYAWDCELNGIIFAWWRKNW